MASRSELLPLVLAVKQGLVSQDQVQACMQRRKELEAEGSSLRLDDLAVGQGLLTVAQLKELRESASRVGQKAQEISLDEASKIHIYDFREKIGEGAMATVFRARLKTTGEARAVKILHKEHTSNKVFVERFVREGKLQKSFDCPNIARGYEYGRVKSADLYFIGIELLDGISLQKMLEISGPFSEQKALYSVVETAKALAYMQANGIVHRDIKPDNIIWCRNGRVVLLDLGFAKRIQATPGELYEDETCGTVEYISPEQARGRADIDVRADIYSLGATLYHLMTGKPPFDGRDSMEIMQKQVLESLDVNTLKNKTISGQMHYFIEKMMAKEREIRYQSAQEAVEDIESVVSGLSELQFNPYETGVFPAVSARHSAVTTPARVSSRLVSSSGTAQPVADRSNTNSMRLPEINNPRVAPPSESQRVSKLTPADETPPNGKSVRMPAPRHRKSQG